MSKPKQSPWKLNRITVAIMTIAIAGVLGAIAVDARSRLSRVDSGAHAAVHAAEPGDSTPHIYYLPAQFKAPEGPPSEPIATF